MYNISPCLMRNTRQLLDKFTTYIKPCKIFLLHKSQVPLFRSLSIKFPTTGFVYIHRNQSPNHSTVNKRPIGKNKRPGRQNVHSSEFEILALYIYIIVYNITRGYSVDLK